MLQQGLNVADVAYFIGEDAPVMTGITDPPLPIGYQFDYINAVSYTHLDVYKRQTQYTPTIMLNVKCQIVQYLNHFLKPAINFMMYICQIYCVRMINRKTP